MDIIIQDKIYYCHKWLLNREMQKEKMPFKMFNCQIGL
jgi:hypothetical protein